MENKTTDYHASFALNVHEDDLAIVNRVQETNLPLLMEVLSERIKQEKKWGIQDHSRLKWNAILGEEFGEVSKAILENDSDGYRAELIQVAAVAIAAIESYDRFKNEQV